MRGRLGYGLQPHMVFGEEGRWWHKFPSSRSSATCALYYAACARARAYTRQPVTKCQHVEIDIYFQGGPVYLHFNITPCYLKFYVYR